MADRVAGAAKAGVFDTWGAGGGAGAAASDYGEIPVEGGGGEVFGQCGNWMTDTKIGSLGTIGRVQIGGIEAIK